MSDADGTDATSTQRPGFFETLARPLREQIRSGVLAPGDSLPSEARLARDAGTSRYSIRKALALLDEEGLITPVVGCRWVVTDPTADASPDARLLPRYRQIAGTLRAAILAGQFETGTALPTESTLVELYGASRGTVRQALSVLESEGLIRVRQGSGRYVR